MSDNRLPEGYKKLNKDLKALHSKLAVEDDGETDMLSLILDETIKGVDIAGRYPHYYKKLLGDANLRQLFLEILESLENAPQAQELIENIPVDIGFLKAHRQDVLVTWNEKGKWQATWNQAIQNLQNIFSLGELTYRAVQQNVEDPWFTLLRDDFTVNNRSYTVMLECSLADEDNEGLSAFLDIALMLTDIQSQGTFPLLATLQWGMYQDVLKVESEGRFRFANIPLSVAFDNALQTVTSEMNFKLESV